MAHDSSLSGSVSSRSVPLISRLPAQWRTPILWLAMVWVIIILLFARTWAEMAWLYWDSSTYNHILFVPFIVAWLVQLRASELAELAPKMWWPGLLGLTGSLFLWLLGDISGLALATHLGVVLALQCAALTFLGPRVCAALLFPLCYMLFLVPFGDELVPALQMITAELTIALTLWSGVPAAIDGVFIDTPAGLFEVAEACSGVKFLIAMIALGSLAAHLCFVSWKRRMIFMAVAVLLPILANGVRAWGTIFIAQSQGIEFAAGFDHIFYGWVFFGLVMAALLGASWRFFDRPSHDKFVDHSALANSSLLNRISRARIAEGPAVLSAILICFSAYLWSSNAREVEAQLPEQVHMPEVSGWTRVDVPTIVLWEPRAGGAEHRLLGSYANGEGARVEVFLALYGAQDGRRDAAAIGEGALVPNTQWRWHSPGPDFGIGKSDRLRAAGAPQRVALTLYRHGQMFGGSVLQLKLSNMIDRLTFNGGATAMLIISAEEDQTETAEQVVASFLQSIQPTQDWIDRISQRP